MSQLRTTWIRIASAGNAIDGRVIDEKIIRDMAETYDPDEFCARIWPDHRRWFGAWGDVLALKAEEWRGKLRLFAMLRPNSQLMHANESDQKTYCSIEIDIKNFDGTGKYYLKGLGVTDTPGSLGCEKLHFNENSNHTMYSEPELFAIEEVEKDGVLSKVLNLFSTPEIPNYVPEEEDEEMTPEQFQQMMSKLDGIESKQTELEQQQKQFSEQLNQGQNGSGEVQTPPVQQSQTAVPESGLSTEQFSQLIGKIDNIVTQQNSLDAQFKALKQEAPNQELGQGDTGESLMEAV
ncbi:GPO family capsid scaffolding protein [Vibrio sp. Vb0599]|uniref:GPO family capsid scaffolding protein n=1 Tax=Vibrio TaxID=662 RepID=UPI002963F9A9|nr:GPO family capsid scaffolding protein [Vibrio sp. Vb0599]MDW1940905.1 GPO family capsid scaffolding protein [Vibrio sp. Vb0599]